MQGVEYRSLQSRNIIWIWIVLHNATDNWPGIDLRVWIHVSKHIIKIWRCDTAFPILVPCWAVGLHSWRWKQYSRVEFQPTVQVKPGVNTVCAYTNVYGFYDSQVLDLHAAHCRPYKITNYLITHYFRYYVTLWRRRRILFDACANRLFLVAAQAAERAAYEASARPAGVRKVQKTVLSLRPPDV